jgi:ankyrin repeat protein
MSDAIPLPPRPNLERYKKLAKALRAVGARDPDAVSDWTARFAEKIEGLRGTPITRHTRRQIRQDAQAIVRRLKSTSNANERKDRWTLADAQLFIARAHGFASWPKFSQHIAALSRPSSRVSTFEAAADAIVNGNLQALEQLLREDPALAQARSTREHRATLLHYVSANGVEDFRQKTPRNIVEIATALLDASADVNAESDAYGGKWTALGLTATSSHPERAGVQISLLEVLLNRGARIDNVPARGTRRSLVQACLANGRLEAAEFFAKRGAAVTLDEAAALGRIELVRKALDHQLASPVRIRRNQLAAAFEYACSYGRTEVVDLLLASGIDPAWRNSAGQTGLHCAAFGAHVGVINLLLERGTPVDAKEGNFGATALDVALWTWSHVTELRERCYVVIASLSRAGATLNPTHWRDPEEDADGMLEAIERAPRVQAALRGEMSDIDTAGSRPESQ